LVHQLIEDLQYRADASEHALGGSAKWMIARRYLVIISALPILIANVFMQKYIVQISAGGPKG
jgi:chorismate-pyruvate lyase